MGLLKLSKKPRLHLAILRIFRKDANPNDVYPLLLTEYAFWIFVINLCLAFIFRYVVINDTTVETPLLNIYPPSFIEAILGNFEKTLDFSIYQYCRVARFFSFLLLPSYVLKFYINIDVKRWVPESYTHSFTARSEGVTKVYRKKWRKWMVISAIVFTPTLFFSYLSIQFLTSYESFHKFYTIDGFLLHMFWLMPIFFTLMSGVVYMVLTLAIKAILYPQNLKTEI